MPKKIVVVCLFLISIFTTEANVRLHKIFSENMILQRDVEIPIYGYADASDVVTVIFNGFRKKLK